MNCRKYNRTRCHRKSASGWLRPLPDNSRLRDGRQTRSQSSALSRTLLGRGSLSIGFTGGSPTLRSCSFLRKWLKYLRYIVRYLSRQIQALKWLMESEYLRKAISFYEEEIWIYTCRLKISLINDLYIETFEWDIFWMKLNFISNEEACWRFSLRDINS